MYSSFPLATCFCRVLISHAIAVTYLQYKPYDKAYEIAAMLLCIPALLESCTHLAASYIPTLYVVDHSINLPRVEVCHARKIAFLGEELTKQAICCASLLCLFACSTKPRSHERYGVAK